MAWWAVDCQFSDNNDVFFEDVGGECLSRFGLNIFTIGYVGGACLGRFGLNIFPCRYETSVSESH